MQAPVHISVSISMQAAACSDHALLRRVLRSCCSRSGISSDTQAAFLRRTWGTYYCPSPEMGPTSKNECLHQTSSRTYWPSRPSWNAASKRRCSTARWFKSMDGVRGPANCCSNHDSRWLIPSASGGRPSSSCRRSSDTPVCMQGLAPYQNARVACMEAVVGRCFQNSHHPATQHPSAQEACLDASSVGAALWSPPRTAFSPAAQIQRPIWRCLGGCHRCSQLLLAAHWPRTTIASSGAAQPSAAAGDQEHRTHTPVLIVGRWLAHEFAMRMGHVLASVTCGHACRYAGIHMFGVEFARVHKSAHRRASASMVHSHATPAATGAAGRHLG